MTEKKHRHHDLKDPANVETRWIEKQPKPKPISKTQKKLTKSKVHREVQELYERKREERKDREHDYEPIPSIAALKRVGTKRERSMRNSKDRFGRSEN